jgi:hypothetical protein
VDCWHQRLHLRHTDRLLRDPFHRPPDPSPAGPVCLQNLSPKPPVQRYEWERPGALIHLDIKSLASFRRVRHRMTGDR